MIMVEYENFKCESCGGDKFTLKDDFGDNIDITIHCSTKDCGSSYTFRPVMKHSSSSHVSKRCSCKMGLLSREDKYCSCCGKKNSNYGYDEPTQIKQNKKREVKNGKKN